MRNNNTMAVVAIIAVVVIAWLVLNLAGDTIGFVIRLALWMLAGTLAGRLLRGRGYGIVMDILLGLIGGILGSVVFGLVGLGGFSATLIGGVVAGIVGAVILVYLVRLFANANFGR